MSDDIARPAVESRVIDSNDPVFTMTLTQREADELYAFLQDTDLFEYWKTPLAPVGQALSQWWRTGGVP